MTLLLQTDPKAWRVDQVIVFDWYDGPREGICRLLHPQVEFHFQLLAERPTRDGLDDRLFGVTVLPEGSIGTLASALSFAGEPVHPVWVPRWESSNPLDLDAANRAIGVALSKGTQVGIVVRTADFVEFSGCWDVRAAKNVTNWFDFLELGKL